MKTTKFARLTRAVISSPVLRLPRNVVCVYFKTANLFTSVPPPLMIASPPWSSSVFFPQINANKCIKPKISKKLRGMIFFGKITCLIKRKVISKVGCFMFKFPKPPPLSLLCVNWLLKMDRWTSITERKMLFHHKIYLTLTSSSAKIKIIQNPSTR